MSKNLSKNIKSEIEKFFKENKELLLDIILFGSTVKGKEKPNDIDILLIYKEKKDIDVDYKLKKKLKGLKTEITSITYKELFSDSFKAKEALISDGYSLVYKKKVSLGLGYMDYYLFKYDLKGLNKSQRMRFYYSLYGRNKKDKGLLKELEAIKFSETILLCPVENVEQMKEYLENWNIMFIEFPILIPSRLSSIFN